MCPIDFEVKRSKVKVNNGDFDILKNVPAGGICPVRTAPILVLTFCYKKQSHPG